MNKIYNKLCWNKAKKIYKESQDFIVGSVLDVGSGRGFIAKEIQRNGNSVCCLDIDNYNLSDMPLRIYDGKKMPFEDNCFDTVLVAYTLHHSETPINLLEECKRVTKKRIIIFEDNADSLLVKPMDIIFNKLHNVKTPLNFKTIDAWKKIFKQLNLNLIKYKRGVEKQWFYPVEHIMFVVEV